MIAVSSCSLFSKREKILIGDFSEKYYEFPNNKQVIDYVVIGPPELFEYIKVNESTNACEKKDTKELTDQCYIKITNRENVKK